MSALLHALPIRTVRKLTDDDERPTEVKRIGGYVIERLPLPPANKGRLKGKLTMALNALEVGECFVNPAGGRLNRKTRDRLLPKEFTERKVAGGYRIWRTK